VSSSSCSSSSSSANSCSSVASSSSSSCHCRLSFSSSRSTSLLSCSPVSESAVGHIPPPLDLGLCSEKINIQEGLLDSPLSRAQSPSSSEANVSVSLNSPVGKRKRGEAVEMYPGCMCIVVDDNLVNVRVLSNHLRRLGFTVETAVNGEEAVEIARQHGARASCIFMDIMMPVMDGLQATKEIRRLGKEGLDFLRHLPIYACTTVDSREEFLQAGMNGCILKPVSFFEIQTVFRQLIVKPPPLPQAK